MIISIINSVKNIFSKPDTIEDIEYPKGYRGLIVYNKDECIFCLKCEKACPPKAILFDKKEDKTKIYNYDPYLCIFCGECVRACPKPDKALWQSEEKAKTKDAYKDAYKLLGDKL